MDAPLPHVRAVNGLGVVIGDARGFASLRNRGALLVDEPYELEPLLVRNLHVLSHHVVFNMMELIG